MRSHSGKGDTVATENRAEVAGAGAGGGGVGSEGSLRELGVSDHVCGRRTPRVCQTSWNGSPKRELSVGKVPLHLRTSHAEILCGYVIAFSGVTTDKI